MGLSGNRYILTDTTLRDGEQAPGVAFNRKQKVEIAEKLIEAGITEIEAGTIAIGGEEAIAIEEIARLSDSCSVSCWSRARREDLHLASDMGVRAAHFSVPVSDIQLRSLGKSRSWALSQIEQLLTEFKDSFDFISVGAQDASRSTADFLDLVVEKSSLFGANRVRLADTVGVWDPMMVYSTVCMIVGKYPDIDISVHTHNDLGMATANAITAFRAGARAVDVTVNGLGERAGNAALEEVAMAVKVAMNRDSAIKTERLLELSRIVESYSKRTNSQSKPIVGDMVYTHESGIHVHSQIRDCRSYQGFAPEDVAAESRFVLGKHSGNASIRYALNSLGFGDDQGLVSCIYEMLKAGIELTEDELGNIAEQIALEKAI